MSEVVKKLVTELGFILKDQDKLKKYSDTAKDLLKLQKETNKENQKGNNLNKVEKNLKDKIAQTEIKNLDKLKKETNKALVDKQKKLDQFRKNDDKFFKNKSNLEIKEHERVLKVKEKLTNDINKRNENSLKQQQRRIEQANLNDANIRARNRANAYDRTLNFGASQRSSTFDNRMNKVLERRGKMIDPQNPNRIIPIPPTPSRYTYPTTAEKQQAREDILTNAGQKTAQASLTLLKDSADAFLKFGNQMNELKVFGTMKPKDLEQMKTQIFESAYKYGYKPTDVAEVGIGYSLAGVSGKALTNVTDITTGTARAGRTTPQKAEDVLNSMSHQFGIDFDNFGALSKASDAIVTVMNKSKLDFEDVNVSMKYFGPMAQQMGMTLEETLTLIGLWSQRGIKGSTPGTSGRQAIIKTAIELADMWESGKNEKGKNIFKKKKNKMDKSLSLADLGITKESVLDKGNKFNFFKLIEQLKKSFKAKKFNEFQRIGALADIFGVIPSSALNSLMKDFSKTDLDLISSMSNTKGARETTANALMQSPQMKVQQAQTQVDISYIKTGENLAPDIQALTRALDQLATTYNKSPALQNISTDLMRIGTLAGTILGATAGIRLLGLALGLPVFTLGAPFFITAGAIVLATNDIWNAFQGRDSWLLNIGNGIHGALAKMGKSLDGFISLWESKRLSFALNGEYNALAETANGIARIGKEAEIAKQKIRAFLEQHSFLSLMPDIEKKINITTTNTNEVPYKPRNYVETASANKSTAKKVN